MGSRITLIFRYDDYHASVDSEKDEIERRFLAAFAEAGVPLTLGVVPNYEERGSLGDDADKLAALRDAVAAGRAEAALHGLNHLSQTPDGVRNDLSRAFRDPQFCHFATDIVGRRFVSDCVFGEDTWHLYVGDMPNADGEPIENWRYPVDSRSSRDKDTHPHPFLSPDGTMAFFNSNESGVLQAYMIRGLDALA